MTDLPTIDLELERMVSALPFTAPSRTLDARVVAAAHFDDRPKLSRMRWPAAAAAIIALSGGLAAGWTMRGTPAADWIPTGTEWQTAGVSDLGARRLPDGQVVRATEALYLRTRTFIDPGNGAVIRLQTTETHTLIGPPSVD